MKHEIRHFYYMVAGFWKALFFADRCRKIYYLRRKCGHDEPVFCADVFDYNTKFIKNKKGIACRKCSSGKITAQTLSWYPPSDQKSKI